MTFTHTGLNMKQNKRLHIKKESIQMRRCTLDFRAKQTWRRTVMASSHNATCVCYVCTEKKIGEIKLWKKKMDSYWLLHFTAWTGSELEINFYCVYCLKWGWWKLLFKVHNILLLGLLQVSAQYSITLLLILQDYKLDQLYLVPTIWNWWYLMSVGSIMIV